MTSHSQVKGHSQSEEKPEICMWHMVKNRQNIVCKNVIVYKNVIVCKKPIVCKNTIESKIL